MSTNLTQKQAETIGDGMHPDARCRGLYLKVRGPSRAWVFRRQVNGRRYELGLGSLSKLPVPQARAEAQRLASLPPADFLEAVAPKKVEPEKKAAPTFKQACDEFVQWNIGIGNWQEGSKSCRTFECRMRCHVWGRLGDMPIDEIKPADVADVAKAAWDKPDIVERCLSLIKKVHDWSKAKGYVTCDNPADRQGVLRFLLPAAKKAKQNRGALSPAQLPAFFAASMAETQSSSRQCFEFSILTATRSQTARLAQWEQFDFEKKIWTVPPEQLKVKSNGGLVVPLAPEVIDFLMAIDRPHEGLVFPGGRDGKPLWDAMVSRMVKLTPGDWKDEAESVKRGVDVRPTQHGIARATFMTWSQDDSLGNDKRFDVRVAHMCLHHKQDDGYNGAYERQTMFLRRRELMEAWAKYCFSAVPHSARGPST